MPKNFLEEPVTGIKMDSVYIAAEQEECDCPRRGQGVPRLPTEIPYAATEKNIPKLKEWLLDYFGATAFNTCEHQKPPLMTGEPLRLHVDPNARPIAVHKPATVPIHWQEKVLNDLERDVRLGVLEKVTPNTPVTWCSRMVVTAKDERSHQATTGHFPRAISQVRRQPAT